MEGGESLDRPKLARTVPKVKGRKPRDRTAQSGQTEVDSVNERIVSGRIQEAESRSAHPERIPMGERGGADGRALEAASLPSELAAVGKGKQRPGHESIGPNAYSENHTTLKTAERKKSKSGTPFAEGIWIWSELVALSKRKSLKRVCRSWLLGVATTQENRPFDPAVAVCVGLSAQIRRRHRHTRRRGRRRGRRYCRVPSENIE